MENNDPVQVNVDDLIAEPLELRQVNIDDINASPALHLPDERFELSGRFDPVLSSGSLSLSMTPVGDVHSQYGGRKLTFDALMRVMNSLGESIGELDKTIQAFVMWFPITDRRVARRIARREDMTFKKKQDGTYTFKKR